MESPSLKALRLLADDPSVDPVLREILGAVNATVLRPCPYCHGTGTQITTYASGAEEASVCRYCDGKCSIIEELKP